MESLFRKFVNFW